MCSGVRDRDNKEENRSKRLFTLHGRGWGLQVREPTTHAEDVQKKLGLASSCGVVNSGGRGRKDGVTLFLYVMLVQKCLGFCTSDGSIWCGDRVCKMAC